MQFYRNRFIPACASLFLSMFLCCCDEPEEMGVHYLGVVLRDLQLGQKIILRSDGRRIFPLSGISDFGGMTPGTTLKLWCEPKDTIQNIIHADVRRYVVSNNEVFYDRELELNGPYLGWAQHYRISGSEIARTEVSATISENSVNLVNTNDHIFPSTTTCTFVRDRGFGNIEFSCPASEGGLALTGKFEFMRARQINESAGTSTEYFTLWRENDDGTFLSLDLIQIMTLKEE